MQQVLALNWCQKMQKAKCCNYCKKARMQTVLASVECPIFLHGKIMQECKRFCQAWNGPHSLSLGSPIHRHSSPPQLPLYILPRRSHPTPSIHNALDHLWLPTFTVPRNLLLMPHFDNHCCCGGRVAPVA